jgi:hypothetical protein
MVSLGVVTLKVETPCNTTNNNILQSPQAVNVCLCLRKTQLLGLPVEI